MAGAGKPIPAAGTRHQRAARRAWEVRQLADLVQRGQAPQGLGGQATGRLGAAWPGKAPSISYMEGALLYSAWQKVLLTGSGELTISAQPTPNAAPARLNVRKSIDSCSAQELFDFAGLVKQASALNDKRGINYFASWYAVALPWWDWPKDGTTPAAYASAQRDGTENVPAKAPIEAFKTASKSGWPTETSAFRARYADAGSAISAGVGQRDEGHQSFGLQPADLDRPYRCGVNAPPPGAAGASASSPGAR